MIDQKIDNGQRRSLLAISQALIGFVNGRWQPIPKILKVLNFFVRLKQHKIIQSIWTWTISFSISIKRQTDTNES